MANRLARFPSLKKKRTGRMLAPSSIIRRPGARAGGGREREPLVDKAYGMIEEGSKSFAAASLLFDRTTRERVWLLYAWCRRCDDIADGQTLGRDADPAEALSEVDLEGRVRGILALTRTALEGQPTADPAFDAYGQVASETGLTLQDAQEVLKGFELDAAGWRPRTEADLMRYCYHVAGAVGVMMARVMGVPEDDADTLDRACDLGLAFQLGNIVRDFSEDDALGRCYIPAEWLAEEDIEPGQHMKPQHRFTMAKLSARMVGMMERHEAAAKLGAARLTFRQRWAILSAARIYGAIGRKVRNRGQLAWNSRTYIGRTGKLRHVGAAFFEALRNSPDAPDEMPRWSRAELAAMGQPS